MTDNEIKKVLIVDCSGTSTNCALEQLALHGYEVVLIQDCLKAREWLPQHNCQAVLIDFHLDHKVELDFMTWLKSYKSDMPLMAILENESELEGARAFCEKTGNIPLFSRDFAALEAIDHLERVRRVS